MSSKVSDEERFAQADKFDVRCFRCGSAKVFGGLQDDMVRLAALLLAHAQDAALTTSFVVPPLPPQNEHIQPVGLACPTCKAGLVTPSVMVQLENQIRQHVSRYYEAKMVCDDSSCPIVSTRAMGVYPKRCMAPGCKGQMHLDVSRLARCLVSASASSRLTSRLSPAAVHGRGPLQPAPLLQVAVRRREGRRPGQGHASRGCVPAPSPASPCLAAPPGLLLTLRRHRSCPLSADEVVARAGLNKVVFDDLAAVVQKYLDRNGRGSVDLGSIFSFMGAAAGIRSTAIRIG